MKNLILVGLAVIAVFFGLGVWADEHESKASGKEEKGAVKPSHEGEGEEEASSPRFGPGKAVVAFDKEEGFQLSDKALTNLKVSFQKLQGGSPWILPSGALVRIKQSTGVYRRYDGWITFVIVKVVEKNGSMVSIKSEDLEASDEVAVAGASFLRMTEADLNSGTVDSCAH